MKLPTEDDPIQTKSNRTWLFGEAEWDSNETFDQNRLRLFDVAEACGYMIDTGKSQSHVHMNGNDGESVKITIEFSQARGHFIKIMKAQFGDEGNIISDWHEVRLGSYP